MNSTEMMSREILRLAGATRRSAFISTRRLSAFYKVPEKYVRLELAKLVDQNVIRLAGWQGKEHFMANLSDGAAVRVDLVD